MKQTIYIVPPGSTNWARIEKVNADTIKDEGNNHISFKVDGRFHFTSADRIFYTQNAVIDELVKNIRHNAESAIRLAIKEAI